MKYLVYAVFDTGTEFYSPPFFVRAPGEAMRSFTAFMNDPKGNQRSYAGAYSLWFIGEYDDNTGVITGLPLVRIIGGNEVLNKEGA